MKQYFLLIVIAFFIVPAITGIWSCQKSYTVLNHNEIRSAYLQDEPLYIPSLKEVVLKENRDLGANALVQLGNFYRDYLAQPLEELETHEKEIYSDLENFFIDIVTKPIDFNLKNILYVNLTFSPNSQVEELYYQALSDQDTNPEIIIVISKQIVIRNQTMELENFVNIIKACEGNLNHSDAMVFTASLQCLIGLQERTDNHSHKELIENILRGYYENIENDPDMVYRRHLLYSILS